MNPTKQENNGATSTPPPATPAPTAYPQWPTTHIPIDPALQQQPATTTAASAYQHYQPFSYYTGYQYQTSAPTTPQVQQVRPVQVAPAQSAHASGSGAVDSSDIATLNDALGSAGVDLRAEEESLQRSQQSNSMMYRSAYSEDRTRKQAAKPSFDTHFLGTTMRTISTEHKIRTVPEDSVNYMALALRARLQDLITAMIAAAHHRTDTQFDRPASLYEDDQPMWSILLRSDVAKQLAAIEKIEREEETRIRRERKERTDMAAAHAAALAAQAAGGPNAAADTSFEDGGEGGSKKKRKKDGPGVTARNMSEDVRKKMSNAVASQAAGIGGKYSWMTAANASSPTPAKSKPAASPSPATTTAPASTGGWARPYVSAKKTTTTSTPAPVEQDTRLPVTLRDAMFVVEKERGHGGGRGAARGWV
ncbi:hypothetical protein BDZ89DRAFT_1132368 [Hymenopellis radicata]|nr:hypothetical protein BDZ89DRAFT_1132368 [Hymenopellis radicata]